MGPADVPVKLVVEGPTDEAVLRRVLELVGVACGSVYGKRGKVYIEKQLSNYNKPHGGRPGWWLWTWTRVRLVRLSTYVPDSRTHPL